MGTGRSGVARLVARVDGLLGQLEKLTLAEWQFCHLARSVVWQVDGPVLACEIWGNRPALHLVFLQSRIGHVGWVYLISSGV